MTHKRYKKFRLNPAEITELEKAEAQLKAATQTVHSLLNRRVDIIISEELPSSMKP